VLTLPSIAALRKAYPAARLSVLLPGHSVELLSADPRVDEVIAYRKGELRRLQDHTDFYLGLQERRFDLAICLHASFRTALIGWMSGLRPGSSATTAAGIGSRRSGLLSPKSPRTSLSATSMPCGPWA